VRFREQIVPEAMRRKMLELGGGADYANSMRIFETRGGKGEAVRAIVSRQRCGFLPDGRPDLRWHISVSVKGQTRLPTWEELKEVRLQLKPEVFFVVAMPPQRYWMNYGEVLHLSETKDGNAIEQWKFEGARAREDAKLGIGYGATLDQVARERRRNG
jgi:hypothetical protein